ncbi:MAG TPA: hypothetical protein VIK90_01635 [Limnochordales bacterium]
MVDPIVIIGLVIVLTELVKEAAARLGIRPETVKQIVVPLAVLIMSAGLNALNAYLFAGPSPGQPPDGAVREAVVQGLQLGAMASGIYGLGKAALGRS